MPNDDMAEFMGHQSIGPYILLDQISAGGMGVVFRARHRRLERVVALKVLFPQYASDPEFITRFTREAQTLAQHEHQNIVRVFDAEVDRGMYYLAMEFATGGTLQGDIARTRDAGQLFSLDKALLVMRQVGSALDFAHSRGLIHRDIKPSNILIASDGRYLLSDFGLVLDASKSKLTRTSATMGTPEYMSPEQAKGDSLDRRTDIYSLGIVLYEMLAGQPPFVGSTALSVLNKQISEPAPPLTRFRKGLPQAVVTGVNRALSKDPRERFGRAAEFVAALVMPTDARQGTVAPVVAQLTQSAQGSATGNRSGKWLGVIGVVAAVLALGSIVVAVVASRNRDVSGRPTATPTVVASTSMARPTQAPAVLLPTPATATPTPTRIAASSTPLPQPSATQTAQLVATDTVAPSPTATEATATPVPTVTDTSEPTATLPRPTRRPPTRTPVPTETPLPTVPPTDTPVPTNGGGGGGGNDPQPPPPPPPTIAPP
jgi:serine/threonine-protein kinase